MGVGGEVSDPRDAVIKLTADRVIKLDMDVKMIGDAAVTITERIESTEQATLTTMTAFHARLTEIEQALCLMAKHVTEVGNGVMEAMRTSREVLAAWETANGLRASGGKPAGRA